MEANQRRRRRGGGGGGTGREELVQAGHKNSPRLDLFEKGKASMKGRTLVWALLLALIEFQVSADSGKQVAYSGASCQTLGAQVVRDAPACYLDDYDGQ